MIHTTAHITDDWQRDSLVIQVRQTDGEHGPTVALGYAHEDADGTPVLAMRHLTLHQMQNQGVTHAPGEVPGLRVRWDVAVAIAQAVIAHTKAEADPTTVARLERDLAEVIEGYNRLDADLAMMTMERDAARGSVVHLERLVEAKEAHLEREARTANHFHRPVESEQAKAEVEQARDLHPAARSMQEYVNQAFRNVRQAQGD